MTGRRLGILLVTSFTAGCASSMPPLEAPVGQVHRTAIASPSDNELDIFSEQYADTDRAALTDFQSELEPYGSWVDDPHLGTVWYPSPEALGAGARNFTPYATSGHFSYGQNEYVWHSDYAWGWIPFHYGRWMFSGDRGWAWVPGRRYAGAWLVWRVGTDGYVGWGPAPASWYWDNGIPVRTGKPSVAGFVYAHVTDLFARDLASKLTGLPDVLAVAARTRPYALTDSTSTSERLLRPMSDAPTPSELGLARDAVPATPQDDPALQRAWLFARPSGAHAAGVRPVLSHEPPRLKEWVAGGPHYLPARTH